jgi:oxaloacetate decarboxylase gamma subunit
MGEDLVSRGLELALIGMGTVFVFLTLLVFATGAMSRLVLRFAPEEPAPSGATPAPAAGEDPELVAVIAAAIRLHRERRRRPR